jgi:riboflavin synthase
MFTGLIEDLGTISGFRRGASQTSLTVQSSSAFSDLVLGESVAVNGVCLTLTGFSGPSFNADISTETLECTTLGRMLTGAKVNLERALRLSDRLGGHLVTGHIDGVAKIIERREDENTWHFVFHADVGLCGLLVKKGSVAVDGISLTVNDVQETSFSVSIIPHTFSKTTLMNSKVGDWVNVETDLIGKYVARFLQNSNMAQSKGVTLELLAKHGYL